VASLLAVATVASCSSADPKAAAAASSPAGGTFTPSASTGPNTSVSTPSATEPPSPSSTAPVPKGPSPTLAPKLRRVHVVTTFAGWNATSGAVEVGGYANVVEPVGTCTLRLTHGDQVVTRKHTASADATTVACGGLSVPGSALTAGAWQAVLAYSSSKSTGEAAAVTVKVP
jgi:hypothetical protein